MLLLIACPSIRNTQIDQRSQQVHKADHKDGTGGGRINTRDSESNDKCRNRRTNKRSADHRTENDRPNRCPFYPTVCGYKFAGWEQFGKYSVFGGRIRCRAQADHGIGEQGVDAGKHHCASQNLDGIGVEHHFAFWQCIRESTNERGKHHIADREKKLQHGLHPLGCRHFNQQGDRGDEQRVVGKRGKELRRHDGVEAFFHPGGL